MPHVGDGDLHAYLDGALDLYPGDEGEQIRRHLGGCGDCQARLEEARSLREHVDGILATADPVPMDMPPFEELRARATGPDVGGHRGSGPSRGWLIGWAASLALAVATGWAMRATLGAPDDLRAPRPTAEVAREDRAAALGEVDTDAVELLEGSEAETMARVVSPALAEPSEPAPSAAAVAGVSSDARAGEEEPARGLPPVPAAAPARSRLAADVEVRAESGSGRDSAAQEDAFEDDALEVQALDAPALARVAPPTTGPTVDAPESASGTSMIPGLEVASISFEPGLGPGGGIRVVQRLSDGAPVELLFLTGARRDSADGGRGEERMAPEGSAGGAAWSTAFAPPPGWNQVVRPWEDGWVIGRGPITADSLAVLVGRLP